jgi:hypothetical protein
MDAGHGSVARGMDVARSAAHHIREARGILLSGDDAPDATNTHTTPSSVINHFE